MITPSFSITATERVLPKLALDFTVGALDPRITFVRTTDVTNPATYIGNNGYVVNATNNQPRFDYDSATLVCKGLLIEESRTNSVLYSSDYANVLWTKSSSATATINTAIAPDSTNTANTIDLSASGISYISQYVVTPSSLSFSSSIYIKGTAGQTYTVKMNNNGVGTWVGTDGVITSGSTIITKTYTLTGLWQRLSIYGTNSVALTGLYTYLGDARTTQTAIVFYAWGAQLEAGAFPTSYIPTTTTALTRNADVATMTGTNFSDWYNVDAGTWQIQTNARNSDIVLTAGGFTLTANATALKKYANAYSSDQTATSLALGKGTVQRINYFKQAFTAAELAAITT